MSYDNKDIFHNLLNCSIIQNHIKLRTAKGLQKIITARKIIAPDSTRNELLRRVD